MYNFPHAAVKFSGKHLRFSETDRNVARGGHLNSHTISANKLSLRGREGPNHGHTEEHKRDRDHETDQVQNAVTITRNTRS